MQFKSESQIPHRVCFSAPVASSLYKDPAGVLCSQTVVVVFLIAAPSLEKTLSCPYAEHPFQVCCAATGKTGILLYVIVNEPHRSS